MEYSSARPASSLQSPTNHMPTENVQNYAESGNNHSNDPGVLSPGQYNIYDEKQHYQYQNQAPSLNQLLQNNQYGPYGNSPLRPQVPSNYHTNYWNLPRSQNENASMYYTQYQDSYPQHVNDVAYSKVDKMKSNDQTMPSSDNDTSYNSESRLYQNDDSEKSRPILNDWKVNNIKSESSSPKDSTIKSETDKKNDKSNCIEIPNSVSMKTESLLNADYNSNTSSSETSEKNDIIYHNSNYGLENKINQSQLKHPNPVGYDNMNYNQMMMHQNANYYSQLRYPNPQNNVHNYINPGNNPMMPNTMHRPPVVNYPPYMQTPSPVPGYGYPQMAMHQARAPYNVHAPYAPRSSQSPFSGHQDGYLNGTVPPLYIGGIKESVERKDDVNPSVAVKQDVSDSGSTSNKSATAKSSSKSKNAIKQSESHPTTPVSNTIPSPSQTSMSSVIDENDDSVSSLGPNDSNIISHHPISQFNQHQITQNMPQPQSMMYPQPYPNNNSSNNCNTSNQIAHPIIGPYPGHAGPQQRPFAPSPNMISGRQYHHSSDAQANNTCFQKLLELGTEPERGPWVERYLKFMQENNTPLGAVPTVVKQPLDLFRLYHAVRERGGLLNVVKTKRWKEICHIVNVNASASGAYTLRRNYIKCLLDYECRFDRNGVDPSPILQEIQSLSDKKKKSTSRTTGSSSSSTISSGQASQHNSEFPGNPSTPRPSLPSPEFNSPHSFPGHNPYNNPLHNGAMMHRAPMHYPTQRSPYPGPYSGPRMMGFNSPASPMHQPIRYDNTVPPAWNKPLPTNQQQWPSPSSSTNSNSTNPMQMPMSPSTPSNTVSNLSQQSQPPGDSFEVSGKDSGKLDSNASRYTISDNVAKTPDNFTDKDIDKIENPSKSDSNYYNQPYSGYGGQDGNYEYYHHSKNSATNPNPPHPSMQYPGFPFTRQYGSTFRQSGPSSLSSFPSYYPPNPNYIYPPPGAVSSNSSSSMTNNSHHVANSTSSHSPYYPIGSLQEHTRRMEWKSNYGGMPPPPPPPPPQQSLSSSSSSSLSSSSNGQQVSTTRGSLPPNIPLSSQLNLGSGASGHPQYHSSMPPHCNYPSQAQRPPPNPQLPSSMMPQNRHMLQTSPVSNNNHNNNHSSMSDPVNFLLNSNKSQHHGSVSLGAVTDNNNSSMPSSANCHSRSSSQMDTSRLTQSNYPTQFTYSKSSSNLLKRYDHLFPPNCVEATQPDYSKKRKYNSKDIKVFNPTTVTMALKSGLLAEVSWALNHLNIWSRDDNFFDKLTLKNIMPLFQALIDVWRNSLGTVFGYDLFIKDLELPINLEEKLTKSELDNVLKTCQSKNGSTNEEFEEKMEIITDKVTEMLDCGKYSWDKNGLTVKLDSGAKLDSVIGTGTDLVKFIQRISDLNPKTEVDTIGEARNIDSCRGPSLSELWDLGGSDSTFHIMPPLLSQKNCAVHRDYWHTHINGQNSGADNCEPPEIKRTRCNSPSTSCRSSSPNPPNLLHDTHLNDMDNSNNNEDGDARNDSTAIHRFQSKSDVDSFGESLFFNVDKADEEKILRCLCVSTVIRNFSFVAGNDRIMGSNRGLLVIIGRLLLLGHIHDSGDRGLLELTKDGEVELEEQRRSWWVKWMDDIREHVLVTLVNISSYLELDSYPDGIIQPIIVGLLHWLTCQSAEAEDSLPSHRVLGCRRLALECVMRLCVHEKNIDFIVSPPSSRSGDSTVRQLFNFLASSFCYPDVQVVKEMALAVMHYLSSSGTDHSSGGIGCVYLANAEPSVIGGLITFIEITESQIRHVVDNMGMEALQARPELMGTSLEFLRHSGALLTRIASQDVNRTKFSRDYEMRMLNLVISTVLDQTVAQSISGVLFLLSCQDAGNMSTVDSSRACSGSSRHKENGNKFKSFLTFDDLSFCDKEAKSGPRLGPPQPPLATAPLATEPLVTSPLATAPLATSPLATSQLATAPLGTSPLATAPLVTVPLATAPLAPSSLTLSEEGEGEGSGSGSGDGTERTFVKEEDNREVDCGEEEGLREAKNDSSSGSSSNNNNNDRTTI